MKKQFVATVLMTFVLLIVLELYLHVTADKLYVDYFESDEELYQYLLNRPLVEKEKNNRFIRHNIYLLNKLENKKNITTGFLGTSRTKALKPNQFGFLNSFNSGSNSYNEITYGLLLEAEVLKYYLPNLKKIYVESSLLLRRSPPPKYSIDKEHIIYIPLLKKMLTMRESLPGYESFEAFVSGGFLPYYKLLIFTESNQLTISEIFGIGAIPINQSLNMSSEFKKLNMFGENKSDFSFKNDSPSSAISSANPKVERIKKIQSYSSYDYLFEMLVAWSKINDIEMIFYQPPVRSDMQMFQYEFGLESHNLHLKKMAEENNVKVINMNFKGNGFSDDWSVFSDEDHLATCKGNAILFSAIDKGESEAGRADNFYVEVSSENIKQEEINAVSQYCE